MHLALIHRKDQYLLGFRRDDTGPLFLPLFTITDHDAQALRDIGIGFVKNVSTSVDVIRPEQGDPYAKLAILNSESDATPLTFSIVLDGQRIGFIDLFTALDMEKQIPSIRFEGPQRPSDAQRDKINTMIGRAEALEEQASVLRSKAEHMLKALPEQQDVSSINP